MINGKRTTLKLEKTATNQWRTATINATLTEGQNTLIINNTGGVGIYIDNVTYTPADVDPEQYRINILQGDHGTVSASQDEAAEGEEVTLTVVPDEGYALKAWRMIHGDVTIDDDLTFLMPDDNVTQQPIFEDVTAVYTLDLTDAGAGSVPEGWRLTQENDEVHCAPTTYSSGSRTMVGFTGYQGKAVYWRSGKAEYSPLQLEAGNYRLTYAMAAWKGTPKYKAEVLDADGTVLAASVKTLALPNANGNTTASLTTAKEKTLDFTVAAPTACTLRFSDVTGAGMNEFLLVSCRVNTLTPDAINAPNATKAAAALYDLSGRRLPRLQRGINILRMSDGTTRKIIKE